MMNDADIRARLDGYLARFSSFSPPALEHYSEREKVSRRAGSLAGERARRSIAAAAIGLAVVAALVAVLTLGFGLRGRNQQTQVVSVPTLLTDGAPAQVQPGSGDRYVWLMGNIYGVRPASAPTPPPAATRYVIGAKVDVIDWTGKFRYHFDLASPPVAISADGTRALMQDGTVRDETGAVITKPSRPGLAANHPLWLTDDSGLCVATTTARNVSLTMRRLDGQVATLATWSDQHSQSPLTSIETSVLSCDPQSNIAVVARYQLTATSVLPCLDVTPGGCAGATPWSASVWALRMTSGAILFHEPDASLMNVVPNFFGSDNGALAFEFLWNPGSTASLEINRVLHIPSGKPVPAMDSEAYVETLALSADGSRILRLLGSAKNTQTTLEVVDAGDGRIIRRVVLPGNYDPPAIAESGGASFMLDVAGHLALVDGSGGISLLSPGVQLGQPNGVDIPRRSA
jgi:hypothetical protein